MKNTLDFNISYCGLENMNFIQRFTTAYIYLETAANPAAIYYDPDVGGNCFGCRGDKCKQDKPEQKRCAFFFLFNTMTGCSALRRRFDGTPTEMQKMIGYYDEAGYGCGTDYVVDFLFGYTGYDYRVITDAAVFKNEIAASINAGKPVISKLKIGNNTRAPRFHLISGYDGDALLCPQYVFQSWELERYGLEEGKTEQPPAYSDIDCLYIFGDKIARRYTLKDGLENIRRVMEYNRSEGIWDEYLMKLGGWGKFTSKDGLNKANSKEKEARAKLLADSSHCNMYVFCSFGGTFFEGVNLPGHYLYQELFSPALSALWRKIDAPQHWELIDIGHKMGLLKRKQIWRAFNFLKVPGLSKRICAELVKAREVDQNVLAIIKQAIAILE